MGKKDADGLTPQQRKFVQQYSLHFNATQAAKEAGYPEKSARSVGSENLTKPDIIAALQELNKKNAKKLEERYEITNDRILQELAACGFSNIKNVARWDEGKSPELLDSDSIPDNQASAIKSISYSESATDGDSQYGHTNSYSKSMNIAMHNKTAALEMLARIRGMMDDGGSDEAKAENRRNVKARLLKILEDAG